MAIIIPVGSGKGGVGKTVFSANLGASLAMSGKTVILVDLDLGGANLHTYLGIRNKFPGVGSIVWKKEKKLENLCIPTNIDRLFLVPGDNLLPATANLEYFTKQRIIKELLELVADYVILDLGAGSSYNIIDFFLMANNGLIVTTPEIPSILNAYSFLKTAVFRQLFRSYAKGSDERKKIVEFAVNRTEGQGQTFIDFASTLPPPKVDLKNPKSPLSELHPRVVVNMGNGNDDTAIAQRLQTISMRNLGIKIDYISYIMRDKGIGASVASGIPIIQTEPDSLFSKGVKAASERIINNTDPNLSSLQLDDEDLYSLVTI